MTFQYHPEAAKELTSSIQYYENKTVGLGAEFLDEIEEDINRTLANNSNPPREFDPAMLFKLLILFQFSSYTYSVLKAF